MWRPATLINHGMDGLPSFNNRPLRLVPYLELALAGEAAAYAVYITASAILEAPPLPHTSRCW